MNGADMMIKEKDCKTTFILGAGATRGAIDHVLIDRKRIKPPLNNDFFKVAETYGRAKGLGSEDAKRVARLQRVFKEVIPIKGVPSMEDAFSLLFIAKDFPDIYRTGPGRGYSPGSRKEIEDFLRLTFSILTVIDKNSDGINGYDRLVQKLGNNDTIISLNYDTALDSALTRVGWDPKTGYGLGGGKRKIVWEPAKCSQELHIKGVHLLKLHGSINWYVRGNFSNLGKVFESKPVIVTGPRKNEVRGHIRQIIPPIYGKIFEHNHWRSIWTQSFKALCEAEVIVVIGCSLVNTDFHLRALLSRVVKDKKKNRGLFKHAIFVADTKTRRKWQNVLKGSYKNKNITNYPKLEEFLRKEV